MRRYIPYLKIIFVVFFINQSCLHADNLTEIKEELSDSLITTKITAKFAENKNLNPLKISVSTNNGIVTLSGYVKNNQAFVDALRVSKSTTGVQSVHTDDLYIKKVNTSFTDALITAKVETAVLKAKVLDDESIPLVGINASTTNGTVTLSGIVKNAQAITYILKRVSAIHGVKKIITTLEVKDKDDENEKQNSKTTTDEDNEAQA